MCGIVAYIGGQDATPLVVDGLKKLEYRGYDSAGIAILDDGKIEIRRAAGKVALLETLIEKNPVHALGNAWCPQRAQRPPSSRDGRQDRHCP